MFCELFENSTYGFLIPSVISCALQDLEDDGGREDDKDKDGSDKPPSDLPINPDLHSGHFTNILDWIECKIFNL